MKFVHLVVLAQVLPNLGVAMVVVSHDYVTCICGRDSSLAVEFSGQIALPIFFIFSNVLDSK